MTRLRRWWIALLDLIGFYVPAEVDENLPRSLAEFRARKAALLAKSQRVQEWGA